MITKLIAYNLNKYTNDEITIGKIARHNLIYILYTLFPKQAKKCLEMKTGMKDNLISLHKAFIKQRLY